MADGTSGSRMPWKTSRPKATSLASDVIGFSHGRCTSHSIAGLVNDASGITGAVEKVPLLLKYSAVVTSGTGLVICIVPNNPREFGKSWLTYLDVCRFPASVMLAGGKADAPSVFRS